MKKSAFRIVPLKDEFVGEIRSTRRDRRGNAVTSRSDPGRHQCRSCLRLTEPGEAHLLLSYKPFTADQPYAETGPIFIHERACQAYRDAAEYPPEFPRHDVALRAYSEADEIAEARLVGPDRVEDVIAGLFADGSVSYIHARNGGYGCFMFRIDRS
jgi:uncharacterized protein DUF1203